MTEQVRNELDEKQMNRRLSMIMEMGEILLISGAEVSRVEDTITRLCRAYGFARADVFTITSSIVVTASAPGGEAYTQTRRIRERGTDLSKVEKINALSRRICAAPLELASRILRRLLGRRRGLSALRRDTLRGALRMHGAQTQRHNRNDAMQRRDRARRRAARKSRNRRPARQNHDRQHNARNPWAATDKLSARHDKRRHHQRPAQHVRGAHARGIRSDGLRARSIRNVGAKKWKRR